MESAYKINSVICLLVDAQKDKKTVEEVNQTLNDLLDYIEKKGRTAGGQSRVSIVYGNYQNSIMRLDGLTVKKNEDQHYEVDTSQRARYNSLGRYLTSLAELKDLNDSTRGKNIKNKLYIICNKLDRKDSNWIVNSRCKLKEFDYKIYYVYDEKLLNNNNSFKDFIIQNGRECSIEELYEHINEDDY